MHCFFIGCENFAHPNFSDKNDMNTPQVSQLSTRYVAGEEKLGPVDIPRPNQRMATLPVLKFYLAGQ